MGASRGVVRFLTGNRHKLEELSAVLGECGYRVEPVERGAVKLELQSDSLEAIAAAAASLAYSALGFPVAVEDAGLFVDALNGFPGPYSRYVYKTIGIEGILKLLEGRNGREAEFRSVIAYAGPWGVKVFTGTVRGRIADAPRGSGGFGFDPIFIPEDEERTFAEMSVEEKNQYSHRARAARQLCRWLAENYRRLKHIRQAVWRGSSQASGMGPG
jgi:XTP/dITP diphosphohydrolase